MRIRLASVLIVIVLSTLACGVVTVEPTGTSEVEPTSDIDATIEAGVKATVEAEVALQATVEARVAATLASSGRADSSSPTATPIPGGPAFFPTTPTPLLVTLAYPTPTPLPTLPPVEALSLEEYAERYAGGPGAIYIGDLTQLAGPAVTEEFLEELGTDLGDDNGQVPTTCA